ncbi:MAG: hypothetical protein IJF47_02610 [Candidatus Methanomethylophilaceae archaeon]|nr:hypothetical protein [Thermoplasmata archaeon]MBQ2762587.1 hypothetical protein [Candidatus Methanomethylophilaceae archaeon]
MFGLRRKKVQTADEVFEVIKKTFTKNNYECKFDEENRIAVALFKGDDLPIASAISINEETATVNFHCKLMFEIPENSRQMVLNEFNNLNSKIAAGAFFLDGENMEPTFRLVHFYDLAPLTTDAVDKLLAIAVGVTDVHDGRIKELVPEEWKVQPTEFDSMMYR